MNEKVTYTCPRCERSFTDSVKSTESMCPKCGVTIDRVITRGYKWEKGKVK